MVRHQASEPIFLQMVLTTLANSSTIKHKLNKASINHKLSNMKEGSSKTLLKATAMRKVRGMNSMVSFAEVRESKARLNGTTVNILAHLTQISSSITEVSLKLWRCFGRTTGGLLRIVRKWIEGGRWSLQILKWIKIWGNLPSRTSRGKRYHLSKR